MRKLNTTLISEVCLDDHKGNIRIRMLNKNVEQQMDAVWVMIR